MQRTPHFQGATGERDRLAHNRVGDLRQQGLTVASAGDVGSAKPGECDIDFATAAGALLDARHQGGLSGVQRSAAHARHRPTDTK